MSATKPRLDPGLALNLIAWRHGGECESFTTGIGSCFKNGRHAVSLTGTADEACAPCLAFAALSVRAASGVGEQGGAAASGEEQS